MSGSRPTSKRRSRPRADTPPHPAPNTPADVANHEGTEQYRPPMSDTMFAVWSTDASGEFAEPQLLWEAYTGQPWEEQRGWGWTAMLHPDDREAIAQGWEWALAARAAYEANGRVWHAASQSYRQFMMRAMPLVNADGSVRKWMGALMDIHEQKQLEHTRRLLAAIVDSSDDAIIGKTLAGTIVSWNVGAERLYGYRADEAIGQPIAILIPPDRPDELPAIMSQLAQGERIDHYETERMRKDGARIFISLTISPIRDDTGTITGASAIARDITARKRAEAQQRFMVEANQQLAASLDYEAKLTQLTRLTIPYLADYSLLYMIDSDGQAHQVAAAHVDPAKEQLLAQIDHRSSIDPNDPGNIVAQVLNTSSPILVPQAAIAEAAASAADPDLQQIYRVLNPTSYMLVPLSSERVVRGALFLAAAESRRHYGAMDLSLAQELAQRAAVALENAWLFHQAQEAVRMRDTFLSVAAHELKTPLTSLLGNAQLMLRRADREGTMHERDRRNVQLITEQARRLNQMILALLDISRIEMGHLTIDRTPVDVGALARRVVDEIQPTLIDHSVICVAPGTAVIVEGDEVRLEQVLQNLISNAIKYSLNGGTVHVDVVRQAGQVYISVTDQGIGIPKAAIPNLFRRFYRASNVDAQHISGMGIGLFVVKEIVTLHGGEVAVESTEGQGSTFTVRLPLLDDQDTSQKG